MKAARAKIHQRDRLKLPIPPYAKQRLQKRQAREAKPEEDHGAE